MGFLSECNAFDRSLPNSGDQEAPVIRARQPDGHIVRSNYDHHHQWYIFHPGDVLIYDFMIESNDALQSLKVELDGQLLLQKELTDCNPHSANKIPRQIYQIEETIPAFSDRTGWQTPSTVGYRPLKITVTDVEGQTTVKEIPLFLSSSPVQSAWDKTDPQDTESVLEQEGFFVNWANGPGVMYDIDWGWEGSWSFRALAEQARKTWKQILPHLRYTLQMFFTTYGVTDGIWSTGYGAWFDEPAHWVLYLISIPVYGAFLQLSSDWCSGYSMAFQLWREGKVHASDLDACQKLDSVGNLCSSTSPPMYCHYHCCQQRNDENQCVDPLQENDALQYIGALQGKMFTGEFMGHLTTVAFDSVGLQSGYTVASVVDQIENAMAHQDGEERITRKVVTMFAGFDNSDKMLLAHSIAPVRTQQLASGIHRVYVYDPNKELLSYGMKCLDKRYEDETMWKAMCGEYQAGKAYSDYKFTNGLLDEAESSLMDPLGGKHCKVLDYILLMRDSFWSVPSRQFHFDEDYQGGEGKNGFMFYLEPQDFHTNPLTMEGWFMFTVSLLGETVEAIIENLFDVSVEDIEGTVEELFQSMYQRCREWLKDLIDSIRNLKENSLQHDVVLPLPQWMHHSRTFSFTTPSAKRVRLTRKQEGKPYQVVFSGGGADTLLVHGFSGQAGKQDVFELYPGFHRASLAFDGITEPFLVQFLSIFEKERRDAQGKEIGQLRKELFLAVMQIHPKGGHPPKLEVEFAQEGSKFILRNKGKTAVDVTFTFVNSFDPFVESGSEEEIATLRERLDLPNRTSIDAVHVHGKSSVEIVFDTWWNFQTGGVHMYLDDSESGRLQGCSCQVGRQPSKTGTSWVVMVCLGLFFLLWRKRRVLWMGMLIAWMGSGCKIFDSLPPRHLFTYDLAVKFDLKNNGICKQPLLVIEHYRYDIEEYYDSYGCLPSYRSVLLKGDSIMGGQDFVTGGGISKEDCIYVISQTREELHPNCHIINYHPEYMPLALHVKNLCTQEEFHYEGNLPTQDIRGIPECERMLEGYYGSEIPRQCLLAIPTTIFAQYTPATDFDWSQYPEYEKMKDAYNCEEIE